MERRHLLRPGQHPDQARERHREPLDLLPPDPPGRRRPHPLPQVLRAGGPRGRRPARSARRTRTRTARSSRSRTRIWPSCRSRPPGRSRSWPSCRPTGSIRSRWTRRTTSSANGVPAAKPYTLLREALKRSQKVAIAKFALRGRERLGMLRVVDDVIAMHGLLWPDEIRAARECRPGHRASPSGTRNSTWRTP